MISRRTRPPAWTSASRTSRPTSRSCAPAARIPSCIEHLKVDYYGTDTPLQAGRQHQRRGRRTLVVSPWDKIDGQAIEKAIHKSDLGPHADDRRHGDPHSAAAADRGAAPDITKVVRADAENARVAVRNVRRDVIAT